MTRIIRLLTPAATFAVLFATNVAAKQPRDETKLPPAAKPVLDRLAGNWLFEEVLRGNDSEIGSVWSSKLIISGNSFTISTFQHFSNDLKGTVTFDPANPRAVDLKIQETELSDTKRRLKIPAGTLPAIFSLDKDRLTLCFPGAFDGKRPAWFENMPDVYKITRARAPVEFKEFPKEIAVKVLGPDAKPVAGVIVTPFISQTNARLAYVMRTETDAAGSAKLKYESCVSGLIARDETNKRIALIQTSPEKLWRGEVNATLISECHVTGKIVCEELASLGLAVKSTKVVLYHRGDTIMYCSSEEGTFEFFVPPGTYRLRAYGSDIESKTVTITVPPDRAEFVVDPIAVPATALPLLQGKPAPELNGVIAWKGKPVKLSDLRGNYVLLEFWGYWCVPCVRSMPVLIELDEKYGEKGLKILGVHVDTGGEVDTVAKLDEKIERHQKELWKGKEIPFPNALASGKSEGENRKTGGPTAQYGIQSFPTCILIDREGKVVGRIEARDIKSASEEIEKLLAKK
jgi:uncharacterized protein (TIGR03067 family)